MKKIKLYCVSSGLEVDDSLFPPFAEEKVGIIQTGDWQADLEIAQKLYDKISVKSFDKVELEEALEDGYNTFNKVLLVAEIPKKEYDFWLSYNKNDYGKKTTKRDKIGFLTDIAVWDTHAKHLDNLKDELFEIENNKIINLRSYSK